MWTADDRKKRALQLEARLLLRDSEPVSDIKGVLRPVRAQLLAAWEDGRLRGPKHRIHQVLRTEPRNQDGCVMLAGGARFTGDPDTWDAFERDDGARFSFVLTFFEGRRALRPQTYSFTFHRARTPTVPPWVCRWDLDLGGKAHTDDGLRSHLHPAGDEMRLPSPQFHPAELIDLMTYGVAR